MDLTNTDYTAEQLREHQANWKKEVLEILEELTDHVKNTDFTVLYGEGRHKSDMQLLAEFLHHLGEYRDGIREIVGACEDTIEDEEE